MKPLTKTGLVGGGYLIAFVIAAAVVSLQTIATRGPAAQASSGMNAFGDLTLFLAVFGLAAVPPSGAALFFLRPCHAFWRGFSVAAPVLALTGLAAFIVFITDSASTAGGLAFLRILVAPLFALAFGLSGCFAPSRSSRIALFAATAVEAMVFASWVLTCFLRSR